MAKIKFTVGSEYRENTGIVVKCIHIDEGSDTIYFTGYNAREYFQRDGIFPFSLSSELRRLKQGLIVPVEGQQSLEFVVGKSYKHFVLDRCLIVTCVGIDRSTDTVSFTGYCSPWVSDRKGVYHFILSCATPRLNNGQMVAIDINQ